MFNWRKKTSQTTASPPLSTESKGGKSIIAALLLDTINFDTAAAQKAISSGKIAGVSPAGIQVVERSLTLNLNDEFMMIAPMAVPYPWSDLEGPCTTSWMWPEGNPATNLKNHKSHVLVMDMNGSADGISRRVLLTHLVGRLATLPGVVGIYWPEATLVHFPPIFTQMAAEATPKAPPLYLWVDFRILRNSNDTFSCFTTGLACLGLMEMEIAELNMQPSELRDWAISITYYMLDRGSPIPNGDTIGATADQQLRITYGPSSYGAEGTVMRFGKKP